MSIEIVKTDKAPGAIGPYSQAVKCGGFLFASGMLPINMETGDLEVDCIKAATKNIFTNIGNLLASQGLSLSNIVKTTVFMTNLSEFADMNEVYAGFFEGNPPARSAVQVAALPKGAKIEIEVIASL